MLYIVSINVLMPLIATIGGVPLFPKVKNAEAVNPFTLAITFDDGSSGLVDFRTLLSPDRELENQLLQDAYLFSKFEVQQGTLVWPSHGRYLKNHKGKQCFYAFDIDPEILYERAVLLAAHP